MRRFILHPIRASLSSITSPYSPNSHSTTTLFCCKFKPSKTWRIRDLQIIQNNCASKFRHSLYAQPPFTSYFSFSGSRLILGSIFGVSALYGLINLSPRVAYAMDGQDILMDDYHVKSWDNPDMEEEARVFWTLARKLWLPVILFVNVLMHRDHPVALVIKVILFLISTKPGPLSVYLSVEELRHQSLLKEPYLYKLKSLYANKFYANKVEVKDYKLLCLARVELRDQEFTLVGIMGGWWVLPSLHCPSAFSVFRNRSLKNC